MQVAPVIAATVLAAAGAVAAGAERPRPVIITLEDQANEIWSGLPDTAEDERVIRLGPTPPACASQALRAAKAAVGRGQGGRLALRSLRLALPGPPADVRIARSDQALQPLVDRACPGAAMYDIRALADQPGRLFLQMVVEAGCPCAGTASASGPRRFRVLARAELEPGGSSTEDGRVTMRWRARRPRYAVMASCAPCVPRDRKQQADAAEPPVPGPKATAGGGLGSKALLLAGGAAAAGTAVVVAAGSSEPDPVLEGNWAGTSATEIEFNGVVCTRTHSESWAVQRTGASYTVDITRNETCGAGFTCDGCLSRAFPPRRVTGGTAEGGRFTFPSWYDVFFGPKPCPVAGIFDRGQLTASSTGPCTVLVVAEGAVRHQYRISLTRR